MSYIYVILKPVFDILNFSIRLPLDFNNNYIEFKLYYVFILIFLIELFGVVWDTLTNSSSNGR